MAATFLGGPVDPLLCHLHDRRRHSPFQQRFGSRLGGRDVVDSYAGVVLRLGLVGRDDVQVPECIGRDVGGGGRVEHGGNAPCSCGASRRHRDMEGDLHLQEEDIRLVQRRLDRRKLVFVALQVCAIDR